MHNLATFGEGLARVEDIGTTKRAEECVGISTYVAASSLVPIRDAVNYIPSAVENFAAALFVL